MASSFLYSTTYVLDKAHLSECYTESVNIENSPGIYFKSVVILLLGVSLLFFTNVNAYAAWFVIALGTVEALSIYYRKPWWLARQMLGKSSNSEVTLQLDEEAISINSFYVKQKILWSDISYIKQTTLGWIVLYNVGNRSGKNYISAQCLSEQAQQFMIQQSLAKQ